MKASFFIILVFLSQGLFGQQQSKNEPAKTQDKLTNATDSANYILGAYLGQYIVNNGFVISNPNLFIKGMDDVINKKELLVSADIVPKWIEEYQRQMSIFKNSQQEKQLFESIKGKEGVGVLPNGVCYIIIKNGTGSRPQLHDSVLLNVKGFLPDGKQFEDTYAKKTPYRVTPAGLIPGMSEAIQIMPEGSVWRLYIPSALAFGEKGVPGLVPPHSAVIFEVELQSLILNPSPKEKDLKKDSDGKNRK